MLNFAKCIGRAATADIAALAQGLAVDIIGSPSWGVAKKKNNMSRLPMNISIESSIVQPNQIWKLDVTSQCSQFDEVEW